MIYVLYTKIKPLSDQKFYEYLNLLPDFEKSKISNLIRWQDRVASLFGKLLLIKGLELLDYAPDLILQLKYTKYRRPYLPIKIDFNIAHSGDYVILAISEEYKVGIDVELIKGVNINTFKRVIDPTNWTIIENSSNKYRTFYKYWTSLESVLKANGRGFVNHKTGLNIMIENGEKITYNNVIWYLNELNINGDYCSCVTTNKKCNQIEIINVPIEINIMKA